MSIALANAPVSYGVFELAPEEGAELPGPEELAGLVARADYVGIDSGPIGMLGRGQVLRDRLRRHGLALAGGWVELPLHEAAAFDAALPEYRDALTFFAEAAEIAVERGLPAPRPTLACAGSPERRENPGHGPALTADQWQVLAASVRTAVALAGEFGLEPTFHHHAGTYVERPEEIDELLERTSIGLTLDTGHLLLGGGDPLTGLRRWSDRIDHLHLKDARVDVLDRVRAQGLPMREVWRSRAFVALGRGDLETDAVMDHILGSGYTGWLVVEQDVLPAAGDDAQQAQRDQEHNRRVLRRWLP